MNSKRNLLLDAAMLDESILRFIDDIDLQSIHMTGMLSTLKKIKQSIEEIYEEASYYDIEYHGYSGDNAQNIHKMTNKITQRLKELYAICLVGLGEIERG